MKILNSCYASFEEHLSHPGNRTELMVVLFIMLGQIVAFALCHQITGEIPVSSRFHLGPINWELPSPISRLWDMLLGPAFIFLTAKILRTPFFVDRDMWGCLDIGVSNGWGTTAIVAGLFAFLGGVILGAIYAPLLFVCAFPVILGGLIVWSFVVHFEA